MDKKSKIACLLLFTFALVLRLILFSGYLKDNPCKLMYDAGHYHELAQSIAAGKGFTHTDGAPQFYRVPGYSLFLALGYTLFSGNIDATLLMQIILSSLISILVFFLTLTIFPHAFTAACIAGVLTCLHPGFLMFSGLLMTETIFLIFLLLFFILFFTVLKQDKPSTIYLLGAGFLLAAASLIRPVGVPLLLTSVGVLALTRLCMKAPAIRQSLILIAGWLLGVGWWLLRSWLLTGHIFFHTLPGVHFLNHAASRIVMRAEGVNYREAKQKLVNTLDAQVVAAQHENGRKLHAIEYCKIAEKISKKIMLSHPIISLKLFSANMLRTLISLYSGELLVIENNGTLPGYSASRSVRSMVMRFLCPPVTTWWVRWFIIYEVVLMLLLLFSIIGFFMKALLKPQLWLSVLQMLPFIMIFIVMSLACGFARLRLPIEPFFIIVSSIFLRMFLGKRRERE